MTRFFATALVVGMLCSAGALALVGTADSSHLPLGWAGIAGLGAADAPAPDRLASR